MYNSNLVTVLISAPPLTVWFSVWPLYNHPNTSCFSSLDQPRRKTLPGQSCKRAAWYTKGLMIWKLQEKVLPAVTVNHIYCLHIRQTAWPLSSLSTCGTDTPGEIRWTRVTVNLIPLIRPRDLFLFTRVNPLASSAVDQIDGPRHCVVRAAQLLGNDLNMEPGEHVVISPETARCIEWH